jgi:hypothetical protein
MSARGVRPQLFPRSGGEWNPPYPISVLTGRLKARIRCGYPVVI